MDPQLFTTGENILLVGEGNFSFTVELEKFNLFLKITASCFEPEDSLEDSTSNIKYQNIKHLESRDVRVLLGVDGTQLMRHPILGSEQFSKIIFNFPHVGGKMKIHLNRNLLRDFFKSATSLLEPNGSVLVSLCKGQGGTAADQPSRRWEDTWQVVEMAAHADLVLVAIEPFRQPLVPNYSSVGYRSRDTSFHTDGALVHVFRQVDPLYPNAFKCLLRDLQVLMDRLEPRSLETHFGKVTCPGIYVAKYNCDPASIEGSPVHYLHQKLKTFVEAQLNFSSLGTPAISNIKHISDTEGPLYVEVCDGAYLCEKNGQIVRCELRNSLLDVVDHVLPLWVNKNQESLVIFSGLVFNKLDCDFSFPPLSNHVLILGNNNHRLGLYYVQHMLTLAKDCPFKPILKKAAVEPSKTHAETYKRASLEISSLSYIELVAKSTGDHPGGSLTIGEEFSLIVKQNDELLNVPCSIVYLDTLALALFKLTNWRELWANGVHLVENKRLGLPLLKLPSLYPRSYTFDICFGSVATFDCKAFHDILWQIAGDIITRVDLVNLYESPEGWNSSCYRIVYQSFDKALYREKVIAIHQNIIGRCVCEKLGVSTD